MAFQFCCEFRLATLEPDKFLGLSQGSTKGEVIVSHVNSVVVYEVDSQKPTSSWNVSGGGMSLKEAAAFNFQEGVFVAGLANNTIRKWAPAVDRITQGTKVQLPSPLLAVWSDKKFADVLLVYRNGSIDRLDGLQRLFTATLPERGEVQFLRITKCYKGTRITYISGSGEDLIFHDIFVHKSTLDATHKSHTLPSNESNIVPKDVCVVRHSQSESSIYILWSDGFLRTCNGSRWCSTHEYKDLLCIEAAAGNRSVSLLPFGEQILIAVANDTLNAKCMLYNAKFGTLLSSISVDRTEPVRKLQLHLVGDNYLLQCDTDLLLLTYSHQGTTLSSVLGIKACESRLLMNDDTRHPLENLRWTTSGLNKRTYEETLRARKPVTLFAKENFGLYFMERVEQMENAGLSNLQVSSSLLAEFQKDQEFDCILDVFRYFREVSEACLVDSLKLYISAKVDLSEMVKTELSRINEGPDRIPFINYLLAVPLNEPFLRIQLRKLSSEEALFLIWYLNSMLNDKDFLHPDKKPNANNIVEWLGILMDVHFTQFVVMSDSLWVSTFLKELFNEVCETCQHMEECASLKETLSCFLEKRISRTKRELTVSSDYSIEVFRFQ